MSTFYGFDPAYFPKALLELSQNNLGSGNRASSRFKSLKKTATQSEPRDPQAFFHRSALYASYTLLPM